MKFQNRYPKEQETKGIYINDGVQPYITHDTGRLDEAIKEFTRTYDLNSDGSSGMLPCKATNLKSGKTKKFYIVYDGDKRHAHIV